MSRAQLTSTVEQNSAGAAAPFLAGKNKIINGDFFWAQRGTTFSTSGYNIDRWGTTVSGSGSTYSVTQTANTPASITGYEPAYNLQYAVTAAGSVTYRDIYQRIEDVHTLAGQTVTISFYAKADSARTITSYFYQNFGSGGSSDYNSGTIGTHNITTAWQRFTVTGVMPSISGKTIGAGSWTSLVFALPTTTFTLNITGIQLEAGSVATPFSTCSNTLQGELALCQRYFWQISSANIDRVAAQAISSTRAFGPLPLPVTMRTAPSYSFAAASNFGLINSSGGVLTCTTVSIAAQATNMVTLDFTSSGGGLTAGNATACWFQSTSSTIALSAEL